MSIFAMGIITQVGPYSEKEILSRNLLDMTMKRKRARSSGKHIDAESIYKSNMHEYIIGGIK